MHSSRSAIALAAILTSLIGGTAQAQDTAGSCPAGKELATDPAGDAKLYGQIPAPDSLDVTKVAIAPNLATGASTVTVSVKKLDKTVPPNSTGLSWYLEYTVDGAARFVDATLAPDGTVTYQTGTDGQTYTPTGATNGTFDEATSTISIDIPDGYWGADLSTMRVATYEAVGVSIPAVGSAAFLPGADTVDLPDYSVPMCIAPEEDPEAEL